MNNEPVAYGMLTFCKNCGEQNPYAVKELTDEEIESWITEWAKDLYGTLYVEPTDHQRTMAIKMARAILRKAQEK
jgi:cob(I)alamin adenosyltransferase